jgi:hypothetical protein
MNSDNIPVQTKQCSQCTENKPLSEFGRDCTTRSGRYSSCKVCKKIASKTYKRDPIKAKAWRDASYVRNKDTINTARKNRYATDPEYRAHTIAKVMEYHWENAKEIYARRRKEVSKRRARRLAKYGLTEADYFRMLAEQGGCCKTCGAPKNGMGKYGEPRDFDVDHCHARNVVRGLLCNQCNQAIGLMNDDAKRSQRITNYLVASEQISAASNIIPFSKAA